MLMRRFAVVCLLLGASGARTAAQAPAPAAPSPVATPPAAACLALADLQLPGLSLSDARGQRVAAGPAPPPFPGAPSAGSLPAHCRFDAVIDRRTGLDAKRYGIGFAVALPDDWNGRLLMQGGGGLNGRVAPPIGGVAAGDTPALARGFAVVTTDTGHEGSVFDAGFMRDQQAGLDFAYAAVGRVALAAKDVVARYYGRRAAKAYFAGCSTGGREGMLMAQRYPAYFDGIIAGAPAMRTGHSNLALRTMRVAFNRITPRDAAGKLLPTGAFSDADRAAVAKALIDACDANDGVKDGLIFDTRGCRFQPSSLACKGTKADGCLSAPQVAAIEQAFAGPRDSKGRQVYPKFVYDTGITFAGPGIPGILMPNAGPPVPPVPGIDQDVDAEARAADADAQQAMTDTASWTNLSTFSGHGGKLIFFHGVSDPWFSAMDTVEYYQRLAVAGGGAEAVRGWSRLFLSPGMGHCGGGAGALDRFDLLTPLVEWVERGTAPDAVPATGRDTPGRSRPLCAYPQQAHYKGAGEPEALASYECRP
jgi:feruloyl esterase